MLCAERQSTGRAARGAQRAKTSCGASTGTHRARRRLCVTRITGRWDKKLDTSTGLIEMGARPRGEHDEVEQRLKSAAATFRELGLSFWLAVTLLEHSEWLIAAGPSRGSRTAARRGARDLGVVRGEALARAGGAVPAAAADRGCDLTTTSEGACRSSAKKRQLGTSTRTERTPRRASPSRVDRFTARGLAEAEPRG